MCTFCAQKLAETSLIYNKKTLKREDLKNYITEW